MGQYSVDPGGDVPPYEQLRMQVAGRIASGELPPGTRLPTVRALAAEVGLAVNTVAKAYRALESDGAVVTEGRHGTFVPETAVASASTATVAAAAYVATVRRLGLGLSEATRLVERAW